MTKCRFCDHDIPAGTYLCPNCRAPVDTNTPQTTEDLEHQVRSLLSQNQKIEAVKLYTDHTGASLKEAKEAVEAIERGGSQVCPPDPASDTEVELLSLLEAGKKIEAVKIYKERTGVQLIEAKQAVEALAARHGVVPKGGGCAGVLVAIVVVVVVLGAMIPYH